MREGQSRVLSVSNVLPSNINAAPTSHITDRGKKSTNGSGGNQRVHSKPPHVGMNRNHSARAGRGNGIGNDDGFGRRNRARRAAANTRNETLFTVNNTSEK
jgi:hypothetical protein